MRRRIVLFGTFGLAASRLLAATSANDREKKQLGTQRLAVDIALGNEPLDPVLTILREVDAEDVNQLKQRGLGGMETVVAGIVLAKGLARVVIRLLPSWKCGIVIDGRGSRVLTEKNCDLPHGTVLIINTNNTRSKLVQPTESEIQFQIEGLALSK
jgi:hypothetical protein